MNKDTKSYAIKSAYGYAMKARSENLSVLLKIAAWIVIVVGILTTILAIGSAGWYAIFGIFGSLVFVLILFSLEHLLMYFVHLDGRLKDVHKNQIND